jgi:hyaluronan synthase
MRRERPGPYATETLDEYLASLAGIAETSARGGNPPVLVQPRTRDDFVHPDNGHVRTVLQVPVAPREEVRRGLIPGAYADSYYVPEIRFRSFLVLPLTIAILLLVAAVFWRVSNGLDHLMRISLIVALPLLALRAYGWVLSAFDRPHKVAPGSADQGYLDSLTVMVAIPAYNEDPRLLDRCIWAMVNNTRPPEFIHVTDDGSRENYHRLIKHWYGKHGKTWITWSSQENMGKRRAHVAGWNGENAMTADIIITVDSDTTLCLNAIDEGLKPFADLRVQSVAGIELGYNAGKNMWTVIQNSLQQVAQLAISASWSVSGKMFTNRGPFALYRAEMIREVNDLYWGETFFGHRILLGDDSLLALKGGIKGRAVQQLSAFALTMWPEDLSMQLRQRLRWARGRTIRNFWRAKYYPAFSYLWLFTMSSVYALFTNLYLTYVIVSRWPESARLGERLILSAMLLGWLSQFRVLTIRRSDDTWLDRVLLIAIRPVASLWASIVLARFVRLAGTLTCLKQGWTTRKEGAELRLLQGEDEKEAPCAMLSEEVET